MTHQKPVLTADQLIQVYDKEKYQSTGSSISGYGSTVSVALSRDELKRRRQPGETDKDAKRRWERETALELEINNYNRRSATGQILPVFND